jgi:8-oxo-dGTP diphosphatase
VSDLVRAAGGIVFRSDQDGRRVALVHRPRYDDWTFPKGKAEGGESDEDCALREVEEETGLRCELVRELSSTSYVDAQLGPKLVRYWLMRPVGGALDFLHEVDDAVWLSPGEAAQRLSYGRDKPVLDGVLAGP